MGTGELVDVIAIRAPESIYQDAKARESYPCGVDELGSLVGVATSPETPMPTPLPARR